MKAIYETRESWLIAATNDLRGGIFKPHAEIPAALRLSCGFPGGRSGKKAIGQYWHASACMDAVPQVFISPVIDNPVRALDVLVHELVHACTPGDGHKKSFKRLALALGLTGKMTATVAGPELESSLKGLVERLGAYPHAAINLADRKKQSTRLNKVKCESCGYTVRVTKKWLESSGAPLCPCSGEAMAVSVSE